MNKRKAMKCFCVFLVICSLFTTPIYAHSGRTDGSGGHRDNKNKSGLGYYHYHCGGYPAHLHVKGVCPYSTSSYKDDLYTSKSSSTLSSSSSVSIIKENPKIGIVATDIKTFINGNEVPTFYYNGDSSGTVVIIEDLKNYGFDKVWDNERRTLTLTKNTQKEVVPMKMDYYHNLKQGQFLYDIYNSDIEVSFKVSPDSEDIVPKKVYFLNGYTAISTDELINFGTLSWDGESRKTTVIIE
jgi:hypothetical protein